MNISVIDGSNYFKGLLLLIRKDKKVTEEERNLMLRIGKALGFEIKFIKNAVQNILDNRYISVDPPVFPSKELAEKFIKDGLKLAISDRELHPNEERWLRAVALSNDIEESWLENEKKEVLQEGDELLHLEAEHIRVQY
ncbi:MAG TPA: hypothetical protein PK358_05795 [Spirochaetota bacterium]|nr:hypothetical protein [Spirochaetota bacterium]HPJ34328.1 hypothetical protein [Spirochaetota bacterium]